MRRRLAHASATAVRRDLTGLRAPFLGLLLALFAPLCAEAQCSKTVTLPPGAAVEFKLKPKSKLTGSRIRVGDYVEFELLEDLKRMPVCGDEKQLQELSLSATVEGTSNRHKGD